MDKSVIVVQLFDDTRLDQKVFTGPISCLGKYLAENAKVNFERYGGDGSAEFTTELTQSGDHHYLYMHVGKSRFQCGKVFEMKPVELVEEVEEADARI